MSEHPLVDKLFHRYKTPNGVFDEISYKILNILLQNSQYPVIINEFSSARIIQKSGFFIVPS